MHLTKNSAWFYKKKLFSILIYILTDSQKLKNKKSMLSGDCIRFWKFMHSQIFVIFEQEKKMCGIAAILLANANGAAAFELYDALLMLQHRGQGT